MKKTRAVAIVLGSMVVLSGVAVTNANCSRLGFPGNSQWEMEVGISEVETMKNGTLRIEGIIHTSGHTTGTSIKDVRVVFANETNGRSNFIHVGTVSGYVERNIYLQLDFQPDIVRIETATVQTGDDTEYAIKGVKRSGSGQYEQFVQKQRTC